VEARDRLVPIVDDLVRALHRAVADHRVTEPAWRQALASLTELGTAGNHRPLQGALLDVWQTNGAGLYDHEDPGQPEWNLRRRFHAGEDGRHEFRWVIMHSMASPGTSRRS
jgi:protocatechuate 3,4-dioxygenase beta subunit